MHQTRKTILLFIGHYLPGYRAGGPVRTIANMVESLGDEFNFLIITRDRDLKTNEPYQNIKQNSWNQIGKARVLYLSPSALNPLNIASILRSVTYDALYFNSFFNPIFTILPLLIERFIICSNKPIILAPRGEFGKGALKIKPSRKLVYILGTKLLQVHKNIIWQASSRFEVMDITRAIGRPATNIHLAPDLLAPIPDAQNTDIKHIKTDRKQILKLVFISRISPIKNLDYLLDALRDITTPLTLSIYGPIEDETYWDKCKRAIEQLNKNTQVTYHGPINPETVRDIFSSHDVFVFPSQGENFGHVIFEALSAGTSVIVSDKTPWHEDGLGALKVLPLSNRTLWTQAIEIWANYSEFDFQKQRIAACLYAKKYIEDNDTLSANRKLFEDATRN